jgi:methylglutaconyl-CoA hydratase
MENLNYIEIQIKEAVAYLQLNREDKRNALNLDVIQELLRAYTLLKEDPSVEFLVLSGKGKNFCAGADLEWMKSAAQADYEENLKGSRLLAELFNTIYQFPKPTIALVHGSAFGGALGIMAAHDFVIAADSTKFAFSEVKLGLIPATIAPYVVKRIGEFNALDFMMTGRLFSAEEAKHAGLINTVVQDHELSKSSEELLKLLKLTAPQARNNCKELIRQLSRKEINPALMEYTAKEIAKHRSSEEGREGMNAFFEKRDPKWIKDTKDIKKL